jgi:uncharacterized LabA/DUF88 family protein
MLMRDSFVEARRRLWIIDGAFLSRSASLSVSPDFRLDYKKLREYLEREGPIFQAYFVDSSAMGGNPQQETFYNWLRSGPPVGPKIQTRLYELREQNVMCPDCRTRFTRPVQKGVDVGIAILALTLLKRYDELVLSTGDGDFRDLAEYVRNFKNKTLTLAVFTSGVSAELQAVSDRIIWLNEAADEIRKAERGSERDSYTD